MCRLNMNLLAALTLISCVGAALGGPVPENKRLIKTSENEPARWLSEEERLSLKTKQHNYIDITDYKVYPDISTKSDSSISIPTTLRYKGVVENLIEAIDRSRMEDFVREFSSFYNRYYDGIFGLRSQQWLLQQIQDSLQGYSGIATVQEFKHPWLQSSIIARFEGSDSTLKSELVILGAHQDSINLQGAFLSAPGADDNASGSVVILETLRILVSKGIIPKRTVEFHWYAAEEDGLRGSNAIAQQYKNDVMLNFGIAGFRVNGSTEIGIYTDGVNMELTTFLRVLADGYLNFGRRDVQCGYACSDHVSWHNFGFAAAFSAEPIFHPQMHTTNDHYHNVDFTQVMEITKLSLGFTLEMAGPSN